MRGSWRGMLRRLVGRGVVLTLVRQCLLPSGVACFLGDSGREAHPGALPAGDGQDMALVGCGGGAGAGPGLGGHDGVCNRRDGVDGLPVAGGGTPRGGCLGCAGPA